MRVWQWRKSYRQTGMNGGMTGKGWTYAGNVRGESVDFMFLEGPVRESGKEILCVKTVEGGD